MRWKGHSKVHSERNRCETMEQGVQQSQNICESSCNKNNKTIRNIRVQKGNPIGEVRARVYRISVWGYVLEFEVWSFACSFIQLSALRVMQVVRVMGHNR